VVNGTLLVHPLWTLLPVQFPFSFSFKFAILTGFVTPQCRILIDELSVVCQEKSTRSIDQVTNKIPNSPAQERALHQAPPLSSLSTTQAWFALALLYLAALAPLSRGSRSSISRLSLLYLAALARALASDGRKSVSTAPPPIRPGPSVQLDSHLECLLKEENHGCPRTSKELNDETNKHRRTSIV
jgi:hypothetical protein